MLTLARPENDFTVCLTRFITLTCTARTESGHDMDLLSKEASMEPLLFGLNERLRRSDIGTFCKNTLTTRMCPSAQVICSMEIVMCVADRDGTYV